MKSVYFARPEGQLGPIKIGVSRSVPSRMAQLSVTEKTKVVPLHSMDGDGKLEHALFRCFADIHLRGEWFQPHWRLLGFIEQLRSGVPVEEAIDLSDVRGQIFDYSNSAWKGPRKARVGNAPPKWNEIASAAKACGAGDWAMRKWLERCEIPAAWKLKIIDHTRGMVSLPDMDIEDRARAETDREKVA